MANTIKVTPQELKKTAGAFRTSASSLHTTANQMIQTVTGISQAVWAGDTGTTYISRFKGLTTDMDQMNKMVGKQADHLEAIADSYRTTEEQTAAAAAALKNNVL